VLWLIRSQRRLVEKRRGCALEKQARDYAKYQPQQWSHFGRVVSSGYSNLLEWPPIENSTLLSQCRSIRLRGPYFRSGFRRVLYGQLSERNQLQSRSAVAGILWANEESLRNLVTPRMHNIFWGERFRALTSEAQFRAGKPKLTSCSVRSRPDH
jgi:hypothetical protein